MIAPGTTIGGLFFAYRALASLYDECALKNNSKVKAIEVLEDRADFDFRV